ncbi:MAG: alanine dehydrogenase [Gallionellaceae bacterium]|jgi:alanine dehydrogenase
MRIGVPREIKDHEFRVGLPPAGVRALCEAGHEVCVETSAGAAIGFLDAHYREAGASIVASAQEAYASDLVIKVKEPQAGEVPLLHEGMALFCYLHLAASRELTLQLMQSKATCIAYETVLDAHGNLPLLTPMSAVAGRLAIQMGAWALTMANGGSGVLLSGVPGVAPGRVTILGGGVVGSNAARIAVGMGADVTLLERDPVRLRHLEEVFGAQLKTRFSETEAIERCVREADLLVGAVLLPGKHAPKLISRALIRTMRPGSVFVDVSIDQGGCAASSRPTTHSKPLYTEEGVVHYCVSNIPAATARTSTLALTHATLPYVLALANSGIKQAMLDDAGLRAGLNVCAGKVTHAHLAEDLGMPYSAAEGMLKY